MHRNLMGTILLLFTACGQQMARGQESAYFIGNPGVRFEQSPGVFQYLNPCETGREFKYPAQITSKLTGPSELALCWPVWALRMSKNGATYDASPLVNGRVIVSAHNFRFIPKDGKDADLYFDFPSDQVQMEHKSGTAFGFFGVKDVFFKFGFPNICTSCATGTPVPPNADAAELDQEFAFVLGSLRQFDPTWEKFHSLSEKIRVEVRSDNQPGVSNVAESLPLYADLNTQLSGLCPEPAKSCIRAFANFEKCKSVLWTNECGPRPDCSAACPITTADLRKLNARACVQTDQQGASLIPDWSEVARKRNTNNLPLKILPAGVVEFESKPGPNSPSSIGCGVSAAYFRATILGFGVAGMEGLGGAPRPANGAPQSNSALGATTPVVINLPGGIAAGMIVKKVTPEYPPVAKAARVQGTVVLSAIISITGEITDLRVIAGPPLLQSAALDAVKQWQYKPYLLNGEPFEVRTTVNVVFALGEGAPAQTVPAPPPAPAQP